jgi:hypothetical protein
LDRLWLIEIIERIIQANRRTYEDFLSDVYQFFMQAIYVDTEGYIVRCPTWISDKKFPIYLGAAGK